MFEKSPLFLLLALLLSGCALRGPVVVAPGSDAALLLWQQRQATLQVLADWSFDGRVVMKGSDRSVKMALHWQQQGRQFDIRLMSFFGQQQARLQGLDDGSVRLLRPGRLPLQATNIVTLMEQELGLALPLAGLRYWVVGIPSPVAAADWAVDAQGRLKWLEQDGWRVEFASYQAAGELQLPRKLRLYHDTLQARLVLDRWRVGRHGSPQAVKGSTL